MSSSRDILRKKMRPRLRSVGPCLAWWQAEADRVLRNVCKASFALDVKLGGLEGKQAHAPTALDEMPDIALPVLVNAADGQVGLFVLDGVLIDGLIEQQLLGKILPTDRLDRPVTSIDAGLSEGFVKAALEGINAEGTGQLAGLSSRKPEQDRAALRLSLGEGRYDILSANIDMGPGVKTGRFELWVPSVSEAPAQLTARRVDPEMTAILQECELELEARMEGCVASAKQLMSLKEGSVLTISKTQISQIDMLDGSGKVFAKGRLGQLHGKRAVRLGTLTYAPAAPSVKQPIARAELPQTVSAPEFKPDLPAAASTEPAEPVAD